MTTSPPSPVLIMIVDDQLESRKKTYEDWFIQVSEYYLGKWSFDIKYCSTLDDVAKVIVRPEQAFLAIVDMVLDGPIWSTTAIDQFDRKLLAEEWPMILVSARFDSPTAIQRANKLVGQRVEMPPFQFLTWSSISRAVDGIEKSEVAFIVGAVLARARGQDLRFMKRPDEAIEILHITDPHFGKAVWDVGALISLRYARHKMGLGVADFLAITGDIADRGTPSQYKLALEYFDALANNRVIAGIDMGLSRDRVFVCPGNHDFSRAMALAANVSTVPPYSVSTSSFDENAWIRSFAWAPYQEFEERVTGSSRNWIFDPGYKVNTRFASSGLVVLELNVERYSIDGYQAGFSDDDLRRTVNAAVAAVESVRRNAECLLVLAHRGESDIWKPLWQMIKSNLRGLAVSGPIVYICGHEHAADISPELNDRALFVRGVPPNSGPTLPEMVLPMVNCIRLLRIDGAVTGIEVHQFHQQADGWQFEVDGPRRYGYISGKWQAKV